MILASFCPRWNGDEFRAVACLSNKTFSINVDACFLCIRKRFAIEVIVLIIIYLLFLLELFVKKLLCVFSYVGSVAIIQENVCKG